MPTTDGNIHDSNEKTAQHAEEQESSSADASAPTSTPQLAGWRLAVTMTAVFVGLFLSMLDTTIVAVALPTIADHFAEFDRSTWVINAYLLTYMAFSIVISRFSDIFGRKAVECASFIVFIAFSLACALSKSMTELIIFRAIQGLGGSGLYSSSMVIASTMIPPQRRSMIAAAVSVCIVAAGILGPILGGAITYNRAGNTWPWIFWINLPIGGIALAALSIAWPSDKSRRSLTWSAFKSVDFLGCLLLLAASVLLVFGLEEGGSYEYAWNSGTIIACFVVSGVSLVAFVGWQHWLFSHPQVPTKVLFPINLVRQRVFGAVIIAMALSGFTYYMAVVNLPERFQIVSGDSPIIAGVRLLPLLLLSAVGSIVGGMVSVKRNNTAPSLVVAAAFQLLGYGLLTTLGDSETVPAKLYGFQILLGFGFGLTMASATQMVNLLVEPRWLAVSQGALTQVRTLGGSIGLAIAVIIFNHKIRSDRDLREALTPGQQASLFRSPLIIETFSPGQQALVARMFSEAFTQEMRVATYVAAAFFVVSLCTLQRHPPQGAREEGEGKGRVEERPP